MSQQSADGPNADQIEYWNEAGGERWVEMADVINSQLIPLGDAVLQRAQATEGERVLDIGCGCGQTSLALASRVGASGSVLGLDISNPMLENARARAKAAGVSNIAFTEADAQTHSFEAASFDLLFSRFGVMFFASPVEAFANLLSALRPGGRLTFISWQALVRNPWMHVPIVAAAKHLPPGGAPPDPLAPGPIAFADQERVDGILRESGFDGIQHESFEHDLLVGGGQSLEDTVRFLVQLGPAGAALREATQEVREAAINETLAAIEPFSGPDGVRMPSATWIVTATRPR
jgi:SAM-dependent methyltransferase